MGIRMPQYWHRGKWPLVKQSPSSEPLTLDHPGSLSSTPELFQFFFFKEDCLVCTIVIVKWSHTTAFLYLEGLWKQIKLDVHTTFRLTVLQAVHDGEVHIAIVRRAGIPEWKSWWNWVGHLFLMHWCWLNLLCSTSLSKLFHCFTGETLSSGYSKTSGVFVCLKLENLGKECKLLTGLSKIAAH